MKNVCKKIAAALRWVFGYGVMISLFVGGLTFVGFLVAMCIGGPTATAICVFIQKQLFPIIIKVATSMVLLGLVVMYLSGETALTATKKTKK